MHNSQLSEVLDNFQLSISLPLSKSVRARELILDALSGEVIDVEEDNDDLFVLSRALKQCTMHNAQCTIFAEQKSRPKEVMHNAQLSDQSDQSDVSDNFQLSTFNSQLSTFDLKASGTALRFLTAYCAVSDGSFLLMGSKRLCERPIKPLVDALLGIGARIEYTEKEGFAPLKVEGGLLIGGRVRLDASLSSQFASALLLIADKVDGGIEIEYEGDVASQSYIELTRNVIERYKKGERYSGERDWSSATVWYAVMAVLKKGKFLLEGLRLDSCQPDRKIVEVFEKLGVQTIEVENGVEIECNGDVVDKLVLDCKNMPDAVIYIAVAACLLGVEFEISGVETLQVKECDRIEALICEMRKCGYSIQCTMHNFCDKQELSSLLEQPSRAKILSGAKNAQCTIRNSQCTFHNVLLEGQVPRIETYNDHRVAMAMAVVGLVMDIEIENPEVVNKSYPEFWKEFSLVKS